MPSASASGAGAPSVFLADALVIERELRGQPLVERGQIRWKRRAGRQRLERGAVSGQDRRVGERIAAQSADGVHLQLEVRLDELRQLDRRARIELARERVQRRSAAAESAAAARAGRASGRRCAAGTSGFEAFRLIAAWLRLPAFAVRQSGAALPSAR